MLSDGWMDINDIGNEEVEVFSFWQGGVGIMDLG